MCNIRLIFRSTQELEFVSIHEHYDFLVRQHVFTVSKDVRVYNKLLHHISPNECGNFVVNYFPNNQFLYIYYAYKA